MRKKFGFKDYIRKSFPLPTPILSYTPLTKKAFTSLTQIKKGMKLVAYLGVHGDLLSRRSRNPVVAIVERNYDLGDVYIKAKDSNDRTWHLTFNETFFYEEEKAKGRVN